MQWQFRYLRHKFGYFGFTTASPISPPAKSILEKKPKSREKKKKILPLTSKPPYSKGATFL